MKLFKREIPLFKDCVYYSSLNLCMRNKKLSLVDGYTYSIPKNCELERSLLGRYGKRGKYFKPKE
jgi:hypothetical protein